jgi:iron(III) transport system ATP-binding protein
MEVARFLNRGVFVNAKVISNDCAIHSLEHEDLGIIKGKLINNFPVGSGVKLLLQPEDLEHDDQSKLKLEVVDRKFRGTNFIYTLQTKSNERIPVFVHSHHIHQHKLEESFGVKTPVFIDHLVCF